MTKDRGVTWSTVPVERWRKRMKRLGRQGLGQPVVFVVGSGLSFERETKKGVADVEALVQWVRDDYHIEVPEGQPWQIYQDAIERLADEAGAGEVGRLIRRAVLAALRSPPETQALVQAAAGPPSRAQQDACRALELRPDDWELPRGVIGLGAFVAALIGGRKAQPQLGLGPVHIVTTNFDPLIEVALRALGATVASRSIPHDAHPQSEACDACVCHVHGSWWDATLHSLAALQTHREQLRSELAKSLEHAQVCVLGYGGWQDIVSTTIAEVMSGCGGKPDVSWAFFEDEQSQILEKYREPLERLDGSIGRSQVRLYRGVDLHVELPNLTCDAFGDGEADVIVPALLPGVEGEPPSSSSPDTGQLPRALFERLRAEIKALLACAPKSAQPKLRTLLDTRDRLPDLCKVLAELLLVLRPIPSAKERQDFEQAILGVLSVLTECVLVGGEQAVRAEQDDAAFHAVESALMAELCMAARQHRNLRLRWRAVGVRGDDEVLQGADLAFDCAQDSLLEPGPEIDDCVRAFEAALWNHFRPDTKYDQARHQAKLYGELAANQDLREQTHALVNLQEAVPWSEIGKRVPHVRFFQRVNPRTTSPPLDQYELAALIQRLLSTAPDLSATPSPVKGLSS